MIASAVDVIYGMLMFCTLGVIVILYIAIDAWRSKAIAIPLSDELEVNERLVRLGYKPFIPMPNQAQVVHVGTAVYAPFPPPGSRPVPPPPIPLPAPR